MSVKIMGMVWDSDLPRDEKYIALAYADHASHDGTGIFPSVGLIAWKTGYTPRSVQLITKKLVETKVLVRMGIHERYGTKMYRMDTSKLPQRLGYGEGVKFFQGGEENDIEGVKKTAQGGEEISPKPLVNRKNINHQETSVIDSYFGEVVTAYENEIGQLTPSISSKIQTAVDDYPQGWAVDAIKIAAEQNKRSWAYINGILRRWETEGKKDLPQRQPATIVDSTGGMYV